jgi:hypothetical protein
MDVKEIQHTEEEKKMIVNDTKELEKHTDGPTSMVPSRLPWTIDMLFHHPKKEFNEYEKANTFLVEYYRRANWRKLTDETRDHTKYCIEENCSEEPVFITKLTLKRMNVVICLCREHARTYDDFARQLTSNNELANMSFGKADEGQVSNYKPYIECRDP